MPAQSDHGSGASEAMNPAQQRRLLDLSANDPTFESSHKPEFVLISSNADLAEFLLLRTQLAVAKDVSLTPTIRSYLEAIDQHDLN